MSWAGTCWRTDDTLLSFDRVRLICREAAATAIACDQPKLAAILTSAKTVAAVTGSPVPTGGSPRPATSGTPTVAAQYTRRRRRPANRRAHTAARPEDYMTKITAVSPAGDCPIWLRPSSTASPTAMASCEATCSASSATPDRHTREHALFFVYGTGANGKSVLRQHARRHHGRLHRTAPMETFTRRNNDRHPTELAMLRGARLVSCK